MILWARLKNSERSFRKSNTIGRQGRGFRKIHQGTLPQNKPASHPGHLLQKVSR